MLTAIPHLTAIGAFERITLGFFDVARKEYKRSAIQEQVELLAVGRPELDHQFSQHNLQPSWAGTPQMLQLKREVALKILPELWQPQRLG